MHKDLKLFAGTSGWSYKNFQPGFYPEFAKAADWLGVFATKLPIVEINSSFYSLPSPVVIRKWVGSVPPDFKFAVKAWQRITHEKRLVDCGDELGALGMVLGAFGDTLGRYYSSCRQRLRWTFRGLRILFCSLTVSENTRLSSVTKNWFNENTFMLLKKYNIAITLSHLGKWNELLIRTADFVYLRLHGPVKAYEGVYDEEFIKSLAEWLVKVGAADNYVFFNNTKTGTAAVDNAARLMQVFSCK